MRIITNGTKKLNMLCVGNVIEKNTCFIIKRRNYLLIFTSCGYIYYLYIFYLINYDIFPTISSHKDGSYDSRYSLVLKFSRRRTIVNFYSAACFSFVRRYRSLIHLHRVRLSDTRKIACIRRRIYFPVFVPTIHRLSVSGV